MRKLAALVLPRIESELAMGAIVAWRYDLKAGDGPREWGCGTVESILRVSSGVVDPCAASRECGKNNMNVTRKYEPVASHGPRASGLSLSLSLSFLLLVAYPGRTPDTKEKGSRGGRRGRGKPGGKGR
eukprot:scaffold62530_cov31-Tisochrysis_lutea.AAC.1